MSARPPLIVHISARQIFDSYGQPTIEVDMALSDGSVGRASVPSGRSKGRYEAHERRDGDLSVYGGMGVLHAIRHIHDDIARHVIGMHALDQAALDRFLIDLDGTPSLERLGANAILAVSMAHARAAAHHLQLPLYKYISRLSGHQELRLPMPMVTLLSGGAHVCQGFDFQDFLIIPIGAANYTQAFHMVIKVRRAMMDLLDGKDVSHFLAQESGLGLRDVRAEQVLGLLVRCCELAGLRPLEDMAIGLDIAASELWTGTGYRLSHASQALSSSKMGEYLTDCIKRFPIISMEDPFDQDDWQSWQDFTHAMPGIQVIGDDVFATNLGRVRKGVQEGIANAALIKLNQNGTLSGTLEVIQTLHSAKYQVIIAGRSGETEDTFLADLAIGCGAHQIKIGAFYTSERLAKYNQLLRIEEGENKMLFRN